MSQTIVLNCPNCATRFSAPAEKFLPNGRQVRCSQCSHVWFNAPSSNGANHIASTETARAAAAATANAPAAPATSTAATAATASAATMQAATSSRATTSVETTHSEPDGFDTRRHPEERPRKRRGGGLLSLLLWLIALCLLAAILTYIFREPLRQALPQAAPYIDRYTGTVDKTAQGLIGRTAEPAALEFQNIHYDVKEYDGEKTILVEADLMNTSDEAVDAPKVHVRVVDADSAPMQATIIGPENESKTIAPNETLRYFVRIPEPPADFDRVLLNIEGE